MLTMTLTEKDGERRMDHFLASRFPEAPKSLLYKLLRTGRIKVNERKVKGSYRVKPGDVVRVYVPEALLLEWEKKTPETVKKTFKVLYEDEDLLVVSKPGLLASQPGTGVLRNNLVNQVKAYLPNEKPALANRLDRGTSGIVVVGKNRRAVLALYDLFKQRQVRKGYLALVKGNFSVKSGLLSSYLRRVREHFQHKVVVVGTGEGVLAETRYRVVRSLKRYTLLELELLTGKMHQIRVQLREEGHPVVGDRVYGDKKTNRAFKGLKRQFLHAHKIVFAHPFTKKVVSVEDKLPEDLENALRSLR